MALLSIKGRGAARSEWIDALAQNVGETVAVMKADVLAAINATDDWLEANAASFNAALPAAARTGLTSKQKARLLVAVIRRRYEAA